MRYYDTSGDHYVSPNDVLVVINWLNSSGGSGSGPSGGSDDGFTGNVKVEYVYTAAGDELPRGLVKEEKVHTGRDADGDGTSDLLVTRYDYYNSADGAPFGFSPLYGLLQSVTYAYGTADAATVQYFYDGYGNPSRIVDELGRETVLTFDLLDRLVAWIAPDPDDVGTSDGPLLPPAVKYDYDSFDNVLVPTKP